MRVVHVLAALVLAGCAVEVTRHPASLAPLSDGVVATLQADTEITLDAGYRRTLKRGSKWAPAGRLPQGTVYRPVDGVLTVEGAHVHEAYLVVSEGCLVGFYLPVERAFTAVSTTPVIMLAN